MSNEKYGALNANFIGKRNSRQSLITPALILDLDIIEQNIDYMAKYAVQYGIALRPHIKTHKSVNIAKMQIAAGAVGIAAATLGEARVFSDSGIANILITSPVVGAAKISELVYLNNTSANLTLVVDNQHNLTDLNSAAGQLGKPLNVLVDVDVGLNRTGVSSTYDAINLIELALLYDHIHFSGLQAYAGHVMHITNYSDRRKRNITDMSALEKILLACEEKQIRPKIISGGGTGTYNIDPNIGLLNEMQVGSYAVMDVEYCDIDCEAEASWPFSPAVFVKSSVVSANQNGYATTDAGLKCFATDGPLPRVISGVPVGSIYSYYGDEHGRIKFLDNHNRVIVGTSLECVVPHCDPTINLYDFYHCVRGNTLVDIWPVDARGQH